MKYILLLSCLTCILAFSQTDPLLEEISALDKKEWSLKDSNLVNKLNLASSDSAFTNVPKAQNYARLANAKARKIEYARGEIGSLRNLANCKIYQNDLDSSLFFAKQCLNKAKQQNDFELIIKGYETVGVVYDYKRDYNEAMNYYLKAVALAEHEDPKLASRGLGNIGLLYKRLNNLEKATEYQKKCEKIARKYNQKRVLTGCLNNLGILSKEMKQFDQAQEYYKEGLKLAEENKDIQFQSYILSNMSIVFFEQKKPDLGMLYFEKSVHWNKQSGSSLSLAISYHNLACNLADINEFQDANTAIDTAINYGLAADNFELIMESYNVLGEIKFGLGKNKEAYNAMQMAYNYKDSLNIASANSQVTDLESQFKQKQLTISDSLEKVQLQKEQKLDQQLNQEKIRRRDLLLLVSLVALVIAGFGAFLLFKSNQKVKTKNKIVEEQHKEITDSINYAQRIQSAMISNEEAWKQISPYRSILFKPKDVVSGDFYWSHFNKEKNLAIWCVADCTGHGVPGALMSALGSSFLSDIVVDDGETEPGRILDLLRKKIILSLTKNGEDQPTDGMDLALCVWEKDTNILHFAGANNPLYLIRKRENISSHEFKRFIDIPEESNVLFEVPPNKMPIGSYGGHESPFKATSLQLHLGDTVLLSTDGYADQFGGEQGKKLKSRPFKEFLLKIQNESMIDQSALMENHFENWKGSREQLDDVCVVGIRIS